MKTITEITKTVATNCPHCQKVFDNKESAIFHQGHCYLNPETRSCASCAFFEIHKYEEGTGQISDIPVCWQQENIANNQMRIMCPQYELSGSCEKSGIKYNTASTAFDLDISLQRLGVWISILKRHHQVRKAVAKVKPVVVEHQNDRDGSDDDSAQDFITMLLMGGTASPLSNQHR